MEPAQEPPAQEPLTQEPPTLVGGCSPKIDAPEAESGPLDRFRSAATHSGALRPVPTAPRLATDVKPVREPLLARASAGVPSREPTGGQ